MLLFLVLGFPVPYFGILTNNGSVSFTISPFLNMTYQQKITSLDTIPRFDFIRENIVTLIGKLNWGPKLHQKMLLILHKDIYMVKYSSLSLRKLDSNECSQRPQAIQYY